jgi:hypothetical protein
MRAFGMLVVWGGGDGGGLRSAPSFSGTLRCADCGEKVPVTAQDGAQEAAGAQAAPEGAGERIRFSCPACSRPLSVSAQFAGKTGKCPGCSSTVAAPSAS